MVLQNPAWHIAVTVLLGVTQLIHGAYLRCYGDSIDEYDEVLLEKAEILMNSTYYDGDRPNVLYTFGFNGKIKGKFTTLVLKQLLKNKSINIFALNWEKEASSVTSLGNFGYIFSYIVSGLPQSVWVGSELGRALDRMSDNGFDLNKTHAIAHSLGAHLFGNAGRYLIRNEKILSRISGCDPAGAFFDSYAPVMSGLDKSCAAFVDITHTDPGGYATNSSGAHRDYWINYGNFIYGPEGEQVQPGCPGGDYDMFTANDLCSHNRCLDLWIQTWAGIPLTATKAEDYWSWIRNMAEGTVDDYVVFGDDTDRGSMGDYFMNTTDTRPYQNTDGINALRWS